MPASASRLFGRGLTATGTAVALLFAGLAAAAPAVSGPPPADAVAPGAMPAAEVEDGPAEGSYRITLITGDQVELTVAAGRYDASVVRWAPRPGQSGEPRYQTFAGPDGVFVIPDDAAPAIASGLVDRSLFDVAYLAAHGFADEQSDQLPVLVEYRDNSTARVAETTLRARADALPAGRVTAVLPSVDGAGLAVPKNGAAGFWQAVADGSAGSARAATGVIDKVWLDRPVEATLDESVPLIGAPEAWSAGYDGTGVTVAVLDTGIDLGHPDLQGKVVSSKNFVGGVSVTDGHGHGTHVASTITGSGSTYKGVAPGVRLAVGKVLSDAGSGSTSGIIDGMEWATQEAGADIVSMSLGSTPTDGTDPASRAVDALTASTGALFVIAAGNDGPKARTVSAPGAATSALTVAATDKQDRMASFSSRGPRVDGALKPDIAAPGVAITAARAAGTAMGTPVDALYTTANGTSMATPHVAGAAAILAQRHPDWSPVRLKAALTSTSHDTGASVYEQGAGRVDVARAVRQQVVATTAGIDFGSVPQGQDTAVTRQVELSNTGTDVVTLNLAPVLRDPAGGTVPAGTLTADDTVTVPAGGTATTTVTLTATSLANATYTGALAATDQGSGVALTVPVAVVVEAPKVTLTIRTLDRLGEPIGNQTLEQGGSRGGYAPFPSLVSAMNVPGVAGVTDVTAIEPSVERVRVTPGVYTVRRQVQWWEDQREDYVAGVLFDAQVDIAADTEIVLDARKAVPVTWTLPRPTAGPAYSFLSIETGIWDGRLLTSTGYTDYVTPTEKVTANTFRVGLKADELMSPQVTMTLQQPGHGAVPLEDRAHADQGLSFGDMADATVGTPGGWVPFPAGKHTLELVDAGFGDPADLAGLDLRGKLALVRWGDARNALGIPTSEVYTDRIDNVQRAGAAGFVLFADPPGAVYERHAAFNSPTSNFVHWSEAGPREIRIPELQVKRAVGRNLLALTGRGPVTVEVRADPQVRYAYHAHKYYRQQIPASLRHVLSATDFAEVTGRLHSTTGQGRVRMYTASWSPGSVFNNQRATKVAVPRTGFTEYFGPLADDVLWTRQLSPATSGLPVSNAEPRVFDRSTRVDEDWNASPATPGPVALRTFDAAEHPAPGGVPATRFVLCTLCRQGNSLVPWRGIVTAEGKYNEGISSALHVFTASGTEIPQTRRNAVPVLDLSPATARYTATLDEKGVSTRWTFTSAPPARDTVPGSAFCLGQQAGWPEPCAAVPLVYLSYDLGAAQELDNSVPASPPVLRLSVRASQGQSTEAMPGIAGLKLWTSTDGGSHWQPALVVPRAGYRGGERWFEVLAVHDGRRGQAVSIKAEAWDVAGNLIEQRLTDSVKLS